MKKVVRLTESDLTRIVKRVILENENSKIEKSVLDFVKLMELNPFKLIKFGQQDFKEKSVGTNTIAENIVVNDGTNERTIKIPGLQLYRGIPKVRQFKDMYVYIWLDSRELTTKPFVNLTDAIGGYERFDLSTQFDELKSYIDNNIVKQY